MVNMKYFLYLLDQEESRMGKEGLSVYRKCIDSFILDVYMYFFFMVYVEDFLCLLDKEKKRIEEMGLSVKS